MLKKLPVNVGEQVQSLSREDPWRRKWKPTPIFLPEKSHGQSPWGCRVRHDLMTEQFFAVGDS